MINLSLIIPCYNEAKSLPLLVEKCQKILIPEMEIILVDNGSTDNTPVILTKLLENQSQIRTVRVENNQGYGYGILSGLKAGKGEILAWTHADMQTDPADAIKGLEIFKQKNRPNKLFVKGKRYGRPLMDVFFTAGMAIFETVLLHKILWDINAQPTMFSKTFFETWENPPHDFSLDLYAYYMAKKQGYSVKRFNVLFGERAHGVSHWNISWKDKYKFIKRTFEYSLKLKTIINK